MSRQINLKPQEIEAESFRIISNELRKQPDESIRDIVLRLIHTTADFEYADLVEFKNGANECGAEALKNTKIYTDTSMVKAGINKQALKLSGSETITLVGEDSIRERAKEKGTTRAAAAVNEAVKDSGISVFVIGNSPTALFALIEACKNKQVRPDLIVAAPIGFVGAAESKKALDDLDSLGIPYIRINGRKGGSAVAATIVNALLYRNGREW